MEWGEFTIVEDKRMNQLTHWLFHFGYLLLRVQLESHLKIYIQEEEAMRVLCNVRPKVACLVWLVSLNKYHDYVSIM